MNCEKMNEERHQTPLGDENKEYSLIIARFQCIPPHKGHQAIIQKLLDEGKRVCVALFNYNGDEDNPYDFFERREALGKLYKKEILEGKLMVIPIPRISEVCYGRRFGCKIRRIPVPKEIERISAGNIRKQLREDTSTYETQTGKAGEIPKEVKP